MARKARVKSTTGIYHIIIRGLDMTPVLADPDDKSEFLNLLQYYKVKCGYELYGYLFMDDHIHMIIKEGPRTISNIMKCIGVKFVAWYNARHARDGRLFHDRFKSEPVEDDAYLRKVLRFIHQEPVRAGLATEVSRYEWSSYNAYLHGEQTLVDIERVLDFFGEDENHRRIGFRKYMNAPTNEVCLEACREKITDEDLFSLLLRLSGSKSAAELKRMSKNKRDEVLREVKAKNSTSTWQIAKVSGFSQSLIARL